MKTLILTCNTGEGHNSAAAAVTDAFAVNGHTCDRADALAFLARWASRLICRWHVTLYRYMPKAFDTGYRAAEQHPNAFRKKSKLYRILTLGRERLYRYLVSNGYDTVICPHVFSALLVTAVREKYPDLPIRVCFIATDYTCSPIVRECRMDAFMIPDESLREEFVTKGVPADRILVTGIPVRQAFLTQKARAEARAACGIPPENRHLLVMCGSMGCGPMEELTHLLAEQAPENVTVQVICGTNERLRRRLENLYAQKSNVLICGYVHNVPELMDSADVYLTKPGGLSVTEGATKRLPMVFVDAVAGCEEYNLRFFLERDMAMTADTPEKLAEACLYLLDHADAREQMRERMKQHVLTDGAVAIYRYMSDESPSSDTPAEP